MARLVGFASGAVFGVAVLIAIVDEPGRDRARQWLAAASIAVLDAVDPPSGVRVSEDGEFVTLPSASSLEKPDVAVTTATDSFTWQARHLADEQPVGDTASEHTDVAPRRPPEEGRTVTLPANSDSLEARVWQPVWKAFRNELSAQGFARRLEQVSGERYRVRRVSKQTYQVEMAYVEPERRDAALREVQSKTGLELTEGSP